jgi:hypothetical protein
LAKFAPFEQDVFETRIIPRVTPERDMDLTINGTFGSRHHSDEHHRIWSVVSVHVKATYISCTV